MTEEQFVLIERLLNTPVQDAEAFARSITQAVAFVPELIGEVRRLRAMQAVQRANGPVTFPPEPSTEQADLPTAEQTQAIVRDVGQMIGECCAEGTAFVLALFDTREGYEPVYTFNAGRADALKALRRVIELEERS